MRKIASYLRRFFLPVLGIVALLVIQAVCDLSLPDYTSKIVNVGIQQGGIENPAPEQIRQSEMEKLLLLVPEEKPGRRAGKIHPEYRKGSSGI